MKLNYIADQKLGNISFRVKPLLKGEYENCQFNDCDFLNAISPTVFSPTVNSATVI